MKASEVLLKAAGLIAEYGHIKHALSNMAGGMCISGAVRCALYGSPEAFDNERLRRPFLGEVADVLGFEHWDDTIAWNDEANTKPADVIAALDAAAVVALQEEGLEPEDVL